MGELKLHEICMLGLLNNVRVKSFRHIRDEEVDQFMANHHRLMGLDRPWGRWTARSRCRLLARPTRPLVPLVACPPHGRSRCCPRSRCPPLAGLT